MASPEIAICAESAGDDAAYGSLSLGSANDGIVARIPKAITWPNPAVYWTASSKLPNANHSLYRFRDTLAHEIGDVSGLDQPGPTGDWTSFNFDKDIYVLQPGDITGIFTRKGSRNAGRRLALNAKGIIAR